MRKASANVCPHCSAMLGACLHTALIPIMGCRYMAKAFRKAGANTQGKPLSRRVIEDAGEYILLPTDPGLFSIFLITEPIYLLSVEGIPSGSGSNGSLVIFGKASAVETGCFAGEAEELHAASQCLAA